MLFAASNPYPPFDLNPLWPLAATGLFVGAVGGYFLVRWLRTRFALNRQKRLITLGKPDKDAIIAKALQEIARIRQAVEADSLAVDAGAASISLTARTAFDAIMNHRTAYAARYEVAARRLTHLAGMLDIGYPIMFSKLSKSDKAAFVKLCDAAGEVVHSCK